MGKGDGRTRRGKIFKGSYGKTRPHDPAGKKSGAGRRGAGTAGGGEEGGGAACTA